MRRKYEGLWTHVHVDEFQVMTDDSAFLMTPFDDPAFLMTPWLMALPSDGCLCVCVSHAAEGSGDAPTAWAAQ